LGAIYCSCLTATPSLKFREAPVCGLYLVPLHLCLLLTETNHSSVDPPWSHPHAPFHPVPPYRHTHTTSFAPQPRLRKFAPIPCLSSRKAPPSHECFTVKGGQRMIVCLMHESCQREAPNDIEYGLFMSLQLFVLSKHHAHRLMSQGILREIERALDSKVRARASGRPI